MGTLQYSLVKPAVAQSDLTSIGQYMFWLMFRNVASDGLVFEDPVNAGRPVAARLHPCLTVVSEQHHAPEPGLRLQLDPRLRDRRGRAGGRPAAHQPAADRLRAVRADLPELRHRHRSLRSRVVLHQRHPAGHNRPGRRARPADPGDPADVRPARRAHAGRGERRDRREPELPAERLPGRDVQPVGGGVRRLVLRALGAAEVL